MNEVDKVHLLELARNAVETSYSDGEPDVSSVEHLTDEKGVVVKVIKNRHIKGRAWEVNPQQALYKTVVEVARRAALKSPRTSVQENELENVEFEISVLQNPEMLRGNPEKYTDQLKGENFGLYLEGAGRAIILPGEANEYTPMQLLNSLAQKAGLSFNGWKEKRNKVFKFEAETFRE